MDKQDTMRQPIEHKETLLKLNEPLKLKALPFAKGYRIEVTLNIDPNNPLHLDSILLPLEKSTVRLAVQAFKQNIIEKDLGGRLIEDEPISNDQPKGPDVYCTLKHSHTKRFIIE